MAGPLEYQFNHIHVFCTDLDAMARWFIDGVGAEEVSRGDSQGVPAVNLNMGGARIVLRPARPGEEPVAAGTPQFGTDHFGFHVDDVDATIAELRGRGVFIEVEPWDFSPTSRIAYVRGPDN